MFNTVKLQDHITISMLQKFPNNGTGEMSQERETLPVWHVIKNSLSIAAHAGLMQQPVQCLTESTSKEKENGLAIFCQYSMSWTVVSSLN